MLRLRFLVARQHNPLRDAMLHTAREKDAFMRPSAAHELPPAEDGAFLRYREDRAPRLSLQISVGTQAATKEGDLPAGFRIAAHVWEQGVEGGSPRKVLMAVRDVTLDELRTLGSAHLSSIKRSG